MHLNLHILRPLIITQTGQCGCSIRSSEWKAVHATQAPWGGETGRLNTLIKLINGGSTQENNAS